MKQFLILFLSVFFFSCSSDSDELIKEVALKIEFSQNWDGTTVDKSVFNEAEFTYITGTDPKEETKLTIEKLRYLISNITLTNAAGKATVLTEEETENAYKLIDLSDIKSLTFDASQKITEGAYNLQMTFGFNETDNKNAAYTDLNTASWGVPEMIGGGYHFMQLEGKFLNKDTDQQGFAYHTIRAYNATTTEPEDTSFTVNLGTVQIKNDATIEIKMNIAEWFKNPNEWDLNELNSMLMPNYDAQKQMFANGKSGVFSLGTISQ